MADEKDVSELSAKIGGQEISLKSVALNTLATVATLIGVTVLTVLSWQHQVESRYTSQSFVSAIKEQTVAMREGTAVQREQTCLLKFSEKDRKDNAEFCKQITR